MAEDRLPSIDKLNGSNWPIWKMQISNYLLARDLWDLIDGTEVAPVQDANAAETEEVFAARTKAYRVKTARVMSILSQTISTSYLHLIVLSSVTTPRQAWQALVGQFERPSLSNKLMLKSQLFGYKMAPNVSIEDHLKGLTDLVE